MKKQTEIAFPPGPPPDPEQLADRARRAWQDKLLPLVRAAVDRVTAKELSWLLKTSSPKLLDSLAGRDRKHLRVEWFLVLLAVAPEATRHELVTALNKFCGYKAPERIRKLDADDEVKIWRKRVGELAPGILEEIEREVGDY